MGMQAFIDGMLQAERSTKSKEDKQLTLGRLIELLEALPDEARIQSVMIDTGDFPRQLMSWRGIYAELAMSYRDEPEWTVADVLSDARLALGETFTGYKGGEFLMRRSTPLWLANYGDSAFRDGESRMLTGIRVEADGVIITTAPGEPYDL